MYMPVHACTHTNCMYMYMYIHVVNVVSGIYPKPQKKIMTTFLHTCTCMYMYIVHVLVTSLLADIDLGTLKPDKQELAIHNLLCCLQSSDLL